MQIDQSILAYELKYLILKMILRLLSKGRYIILIILLLFVMCSIYFYTRNLHYNHDSAQYGDRCISELSSIRYQLNVVTEYKNRIDKLLTETQKAHESDKEKFKDIMETCGAMKQHTVICQSQFEDLQGECKKIKEEYDKLLKETQKSK